MLSSQSAESIGLLASGGYKRLGVKKKTIRSGFLQTLQPLPYFLWTGNVCIYPIRYASWSMKRHPINHEVKQSLKVLKKDPNSSSFELWWSRTQGKNKHYEINSWSSGIVLYILIYLQQIFQHYNVFFWRITFKNTYTWYTVMSDHFPLSTKYTQTRAFSTLSQDKCQLLGR
jgi:hypothetical protein